MLNGYTVAVVYGTFTGAANVGCLQNKHDACSALHVHLHNLHARPALPCTHTCLYNSGIHRSAQLSIPVAYKRT